MKRLVLVAVVAALAARLPAAAERLAKDLSAECPSPVYGEIVKIVRSSVGQLA